MLGFNNKEFANANADSLFKLCKENLNLESAKIIFYDIIMVLCLDYL